MTPSLDPPIPCADGCRRNAVTETSCDDCGDPLCPDCRTFSRRYSRGGIRRYGLTCAECEREARHESHPSHLAGCSISEWIEYLGDAGDFPACDCAVAREAAP